MKYIDLNDPELDKEADQEFYKAYNMDKFSLSMSVIKCVIVLIVGVSILFGYTLAHVWAEGNVWLIADNFYSGEYGNFNDGGIMFFDNKMFLDGYDLTISDLVNSSIYSDNALYCLGDYNQKRVVSYDNLSVDSGFVDLYTAAGGVVFYSTSPQSVTFNEFEWDPENKSFDLIGTSVHDMILHPNGVWYYITLSPKIFFAGADVGIYVNNSPFDTSLNVLNYNLNYKNVIGGGSEPSETAQNNLFLPSLDVSLRGNQLSGSNNLARFFIKVSLSPYQKTHIDDFNFNYQISFNGSFKAWDPEFGDILNTDVFPLSGQVSNSIPLNMFPLNNYLLTKNVPNFNSNLWQQKNVDSSIVDTLVFKKDSYVNGDLFKDELQEAVITYDCWISDITSGQTSRHSVYKFNVLSGYGSVINDITVNDNPFVPSVPQEFPSDNPSGVGGDGFGSGSSSISGGNVNVTVNNNNSNVLTNLVQDQQNPEVKQQFESAYGAVQEVQHNKFLTVMKNVFNIFPFDFWAPFIAVFGVITALIVIRAVMNIIG